MNTTVKMYGIHYRVRLAGDIVTIWSMDRQAYVRSIPKADWHVWRDSFLTENPWAILVSSHTGRRYAHA